MFQGATALNLDAKGRLAVPARHRDALAPGGAPLVMTAHPHGCLLVYPLAAWEPIRERINALPGLDRQSATLKRLMVGHAQEEELDSAGRVLVSPLLRNWAKLDKQVYLVGQGNYCELWSDTGWEAQQAAMLDLSLEDLPPGFEGLVL